MAADSWGLSWGGTTGSWLSSWAGSGSQAPDTPTTQTPAGRSKRHRYFVQIDGHDFEVRSQQEAVEILQQAAAIADRAAEKAAERKAQSLPKTPKVQPVALKPPVITTNAPIDITPYLHAIERAYRNAAAAAEMRLLLEAQMREEDEIAAYLLLQ